MTRYYNYIFWYYCKRITVSKAVTDRMAVGPIDKMRYAVEYFNDFLRRYAGYHNSPVTVLRIAEVKRSETIAKKQTLETMEAAKRAYVI